MSNNIEQKIKKEFRNREITPSTNSWEILNAKLETNTLVKKNKKLIYFSYAAVFIGLLFGLLFFINNTNDINLTNDKETIIAVKKENLNKIDVIIDNSKKEVKEVAAHQIKKSPESNKTSYASTLKKKKKVEKNIAIAKVKEQQHNNTKEEIAYLPVKNTAELQVALNVANTDVLKAINNKVKPNVTPIKMASTDADIEAMLAKEMATYSQDLSRGFTVEEEDLMLNVANPVEEFHFRNRIKQILIAGVDTVEEFVTNNN